jgi:hypothetical protein
VRRVCDGTERERVGKGAKEEKMIEEVIQARSCALQMWRTILCSVAVIFPANYMSGLCPVFTDVLGQFG